MKSNWKVIILLLFLANITITVTGQDIKTDLTEEHLQVPGTQIFMIPPDGFDPSPNFQGFQQYESSSSIMVAHIPGPFNKIKGSINKQSLKSQGMDTKKITSVKVNEYDGIYVKAEQFAHQTYFTKYVLFFGDDEHTYTVAGMYPKQLKKLDAPIQEAIKTIYIDLEANEQPLESVNFTISTDGTKLQFAKNMGDMLMYTVDGEVPTQSTDQTALIAGQSISEVEIEDRKLFSLNRIRLLPYKDIQIEESDIQPFQQDEISGYAVKGLGINPQTNERELVYQVILYSDKLYYIIVGMATDDYEDNLKLFKKIISTFHRK